MRGGGGGEKAWFRPLAPDVRLIGARGILELFVPKTNTYIPAARKRFGPGPALAAAWLIIGPLGSCYGNEPSQLVEYPHSRLPLFHLGQGQGANGLPAVNATVAAPHFSPSSHSPGLDLLQGANLPEGCGRPGTGLVPTGGHHRVRL